MKIEADKNWTVEEAIAAQQKAEAEGATYAADGPLDQWLALRRLDVLAASFSKGDRGALLEAVHLCAWHSLLIPDWAAMAFLKGYRLVQQAKSLSWDEAFGRPYPKGTNIRRVRKEKELPRQIYRMIETEYSGHSIGQALFEIVGRRFNIGADDCKRLYYLWPKQNKFLSKK